MLMLYFKSIQYSVLAILCLKRDIDVRRALTLFSKYDKPGKICDISGLL